VKRTLIPRQGAQSRLKEGEIVLPGDRVNGSGTGLEPYSRTRESDGDSPESAKGKNDSWGIQN